MGEDSELVELVEELFQYFDLDYTDNPVCSVYSQGAFYTGVVEEDLELILTKLKEYIEENYGR